MKRLAFTVAATLFAAVAVFGQTQWKLDRGHSGVGFAVTHMVIAEVDGRFTDFDVEFTTNGEDLAGATVAATIQMASVNTDNERRDNHLRSADFFDAENHPVMTFKSSKFEKVNETKYKLAGDLTIRGNTKPVVLDVTYRGKITDSRGNMRMGLKGTTTVDRFEFGTVWDKTIEDGGLIVGREVEVTIKLELVHAAPEKKE